MAFLFKPIKISYGVTVCNEAEELERLLECLVCNIGKKDEIIILSDKINVTTDVLAIIHKYLKADNRTKHITFALNSDFATFKNNLIESAKGDYLFQIDADEIPNTYLLKKIKSFLFIYRWYDCFNIPRVNYVEGITEEHIKKWNWKIDYRNRVNYPDLQMRLFKLNKEIRWKNKVHEVLINWSKVKKFPYKKNENYCLYHPKQIKRQEKQNDFYETIDTSDNNS